MNNIASSVIVKEYYEIVSPFLTFNICERINEIDKQILKLTACKRNVIT